ncbi:MAG: YdcH family protein [Gammaproteobacteria bacterium]|nr:YdcH family protein [Gammaproteobacteria bacterium]
MFEADNATVEALLQQDDAFRRLYEKHASLNARVDHVTAGDEPMEDLQLENLKKEKLLLADRMQDMIREYRGHH